MLRGGWARLWLSSGSGLSPSPPASIWARLCWIAASWEAAKSAVSVGDSVRSRYVLRGAAQYTAKSITPTAGWAHAASDSGDGPGFFKRCASFVAMNSRLPMGLPRTTTPCWAAGMAQFPVQQGCSVSSGGSSSSSPGGSSPALFHARVLPRCTWMLACLARASRTMANWPAVCSGGPVTGLEFASSEHAPAAPL